MRLRALNLVELTGGRNLGVCLVIHDIIFNTSTKLEEMVDRVLRYLGVPLDEQRSWADDDAALKNRRDAFLAAGIYMFKDACLVDQFSGLCLYDNIFQTIYVKASSPKTRQIFTLFREPAHLLSYTNGIETVHDAFIPALAEPDDA